MANLSTRSAAWMALVLALAAAVADAAPVVPSAPSPAFLQYWKSGLAELSSYDITTERYGEMREAQGVMVFVYEEINADTRIKIESDKTPPAKRIPVLKLNNVLKFTTGVYDYSIMTSVFAGLTAPGAQRPFPPQKISFTSQEWCGNVFHQIVPRPKGLVSEIHSYFESEGDAAALLPYPKGPKGVPAAIYYEDEMPILVRELDGAVWPLGTPRKINLVPGLWERRKRHVPLAFTEAVLTKVGPEKFAGPAEATGVGTTGAEGAGAQSAGSGEAMKWTLEIMGQTTTYHVEAAAPRHLLGWENGKGEKGRMIASLRSTYWEHNHNIDQPLRGKLGLTFGVKGK
jgi:hypothetical protein